MFAKATEKAEEDKPYELDDFLSKRDYKGAITWLEFHRPEGRLTQEDSEHALWLAYAYFHYGEHDKVPFVATTRNKQRERERGIIAKPSFVR